MIDFKNHLHIYSLHWLVILLSLRSILIHTIHTKFDIVISRISTIFVTLVDAILIIPYYLYLLFCIYYFRVNNPSKSEHTLIELEEIFKKIGTENLNMYKKLLKEEF